MNGTFDQYRHNNDASKGVEKFLLMPAKFILILFI